MAEPSTVLKVESSSRLGRQGGGPHQLFAQVESFPVVGNIVLHLAAVVARLFISSEKVVTIPLHGGKFVH